MKFFSGDNNNMPVEVIQKEETKPCGAIFITQSILEQLEEIVGKENIKMFNSDIS